jgi:hypothetical protein
MKCCGNCKNFIKVKCWKDGRKGYCGFNDTNITDLKYKCNDYKPIRYKRDKNEMP